MKYVSAELTRYYVNRGGVFVLGRSLGGAVAANTIAEMDQDNAYFDIDGVILENTFTSIEALVEDRFGMLAYFKSLILTNYWNVLEMVPKIKLPMHFVGGRKDQIVPYHHLETLMSASTNSSWTNQLD